MANLTSSDSPDLSALLGHAGPGPGAAGFTSEVEALRSVIDQTVGFVGLLEPDGTLVEANAPALESGGVARDEVIGRKFWDCYWWNHDPQEVARLQDAVRRAAQGDVVRYDALVRMSGDTRMWIAFMVSPLRDGAGKVAALVPSGFDITERKAAETRLRAAHDTFRDLVARSPFGIYTVDADFRLHQVSHGAQKVFENVNPLIGRDFSEVLRVIWPEPFASETIGLFRRTLETGEPYHSPSMVETRADIKEREAYDWKIERLTLPDGRDGVVCHFYDLTERQRFEEQIKMLMREVNHRAKNMLSLVLSIARQTAASSPEDFVERFTQRIQGLSAGQDVLVQSGWRHVPIHALVRAQLSHFQDLIGQRIHLDGPELEVTAAAAQTMGLALHELATNAAKYGALSAPSGEVTLRWRLETAQGKPRFCLEWREAGGPDVTQPQRRGFGSTMTGHLVRSSLNGEVETRYAASGVIWRLECPADGVIEDPFPLRKPLTEETGYVDSQPDNTVLVVDDEPLIALDIAEGLDRAGYKVLGPANSVAQARTLLSQSRCAAAVLDVNLGRETSVPLARELRSLGIPFIAVSGYSATQLPDEFEGVPLIGKPMNFATLFAQLGKILTPGSV
ncbi:PAS domain-containing protein [Marinovum sp.]|uniref:PAS domain-containing protein n=1 Tax=Marinovum sp. TaxID=2024839 RepID=UPI002B26F31B|nr:PAS domain-containing protein [Marinovum sp.]